MRNCVKKISSFSIKFQSVKMSSERKIHFFTFLSLICVTVTVKPIQFINGGYRGITVAIHPDVAESDQLISNLEQLLKQSSSFLYNATTGKARFVEINVIIPKTWSKRDDYELIAGSHYDKSHVRVNQIDPIRGDEPHTFQPRGCGQPGEYIQLADSFVKQLNDKTKENFGSPEKHFIHEWAHYRYGVFDEYGIPGDSKYPTFYLDNNGNVVPTTCVKGIRGKQSDNTGRPCRIYSGGRVDPNCNFIPDQKSNDALASIMFIPTIDSINSFCQNNTTDSRLLHNKYAPSKHNIMCNYRSTSEVINDHEDFKTLNMSLLTAQYNDPIIRLFRVDEEQSSRFVLVLDTSGSMRDNGRINLLNRAGTRFVKDLIPSGMELGIIEFSTNATILHSMASINDTSRQSLAEMIPKVAEGWTAIGKGFKLALEILRENGGETRGATIILVSDGEENQKEPTIEEIMPEVLDAGVKIDAIAVAVEADKRLENITQLSGGRCFYMKDYDDATNTLMETAFMGFVSQQNDVEFQAVVIKNRQIDIVKDRNIIRKVIIDKELGKNTRFVVSSSDIDRLNVNFRSPDGQIYGENNYFYRKDSALKNVQLHLPESQVGHWEVIYGRDQALDRGIAVALSVASEPNDPRQQPIRLNTFFGKLEVRYPATAAIYAEVKRGHNPVVKATVIATVERPVGDSVEVKLYDDGSGIDVSANDGIYTTAFTQFTSNGRYSVSATVTSDQETRIRKTRSHYAFSRSSKIIKSLFNHSSSVSKSEFKVSEFIPTTGIPEEDFETEAVDEFSRESEIGAFKLEQFQPGIDLIPPARVTNLQVVSVDEEDYTVELQWTAPGDDYFNGNASEIDLRASLSEESLHNPGLFGQTTAIQEDMLVAGSLEPPEGGNTMRAKFQIPQTMYKTSKPRAKVDEKVSIYFALRATDPKNNTGEVSNMAYVHFGYVKPNFDNIIIGTNSRPFESVLTQTNVILPNPVLFYHNRILMQRSKNTTWIRVPKELGRNTRFTITSDDIDLLDITISSPNGTVYNRKSKNFKIDSSDMTAQYSIELANSGKWRVRFEKEKKETVIAYLSVTSESRVDEPIKTRAWMDTPFMNKDNPPSVVVNAEVTKRYNYIICADVIAIVDRPQAEPIAIALRDNGLGADKVANDGLYSGVFTSFNSNGRYGVIARVLNNQKARLKLGVEDEKIKCI